MSYACRKKNRYRNYGDAQRGLTTARQKHSASDTLPTRAYECPECRGWHLTSQPEQAPKAFPVSRRKPKGWTDADEARWERLTRARA